MPKRPIALLALLLGLAIGISSPRTRPAHAQVALDVLGVSFEFRDGAGGPQLLVTALVKNPSTFYVFHVSGRYELKVDGTTIAQDRAGFALKDVLAPGESTVLQKTIANARALEVTSVDIPYVVTDETSLVSHMGYAPPPTILRADRGTSADGGDHYLVELLNDSGMDYQATSTQVAALSANAVYFLDDQVVGIAEDCESLPQGHVPVGEHIALRCRVPDKAIEHDRMELFFSVRRFDALDTTPLTWAVENLSFSVEGSGSFERVYVKGDLRNADTVDGDPDLVYLLKDQAGRLVGWLHCRIDLTLVPGEVIDCSESMAASELSGPAKSVASVSAIALSHAWRGQVPTPEASATLKCTPPACPGGVLVGPDGCSLTCVPYTPTPSKTPTGKELWLPRLVRPLP